MSLKNINTSAIIINIRRHVNELEKLLYSYKCQLTEMYNDFWGQLKD